MKACEPAVKQAYEAGRFEDVLRALTSLKAPVDAFFADVMVNADDPAVRANRQALLKRLYTLMNSVAELSRLAK
jgi:glycyl-tRNA synthetase beta chain